MCLKYLHDEADTSAVRQRSRNKMLCRAQPNLLQMTYVLKEKFQQHTDKRLKAHSAAAAAPPRSSFGMQLSALHSRLGRGTKIEEEA